MTAHNYKNFWDNKASSYTGAMIAVDGSNDESALIATGQRSCKQVIAALNVCATDRVLEVGCGVARIGLPLSERVGFWQGVDISQNMVDVAKQRLAGRTNTDALALTRPHLPFADGSFDAAYAIAVFIHMDKEDFFLYLREIQRVLKPGGKVFFDHWNLSHPVGFKRFLYEANFYEKNGDVSVRKDVARNQFTTPEEVDVFVRQAGLSPTLIMGDTPWVQALAIKSTDVAQVQAESARANAARDDVGYDQNWTRYFDWVLPVVFDGVHPNVILQQLALETPGEVRQMFETWLISAWRNNAVQYGPLPAGL
jgi:SAM-dependent methyltransferase